MGYFDFFSQPQITRKPLVLLGQINLPLSQGDGRTQARSRPQPRNRTPTAQRRKWGICGGILAAVGRVDATNRPSGGQPSPPRCPRFGGFGRFWPSSGQASDRQDGRIEDGRRRNHYRNGRHCSTRNMGGETDKRLTYHAVGIMLITC